MAEEQLLTKSLIQACELWLVAIRDEHIGRNFVNVIRFREPLLRIIDRYRATIPQVTCNAVQRSMGIKLAMTK